MSQVLVLASAVKQGADQETESAFPTVRALALLSNQCLLVLLEPGYPLVTAPRVEAIVPSPFIYFWAAGVLL